MNGKAKTILLVEDEPTSAEALGLALAKLGYRSLLAAKGEEAIEEFGRDSSIDLILMDVELGAGIDGPSAARAMLGQRPCPLVFISSHSEPEILEKTTELASQGYFVKGSGMAVLDVTLRTAFRIFEAERALRALSQRFSNLASNMPGFVAYVDAKTLRYEFVNEAFEKAFGIPRERIVGSEVRTIIGEANFRYALKYIEEAQAGRAVSYENLFNFTYGKRWLKVNFSPVFGADGSVASIVVLNYDITERKEAEDLLRKSEERLRNIIVGTNAGTWEQDAVTGDMIINDKTLSFLGYEGDELRPLNLRRWRTMKHPDDLAGADEALARLLRGETEYYSFESRMRHKDGRWVWILARGKIIERDEEGRPRSLAGTFMDITDRKLAEIRIEKLLAEKELILKEVHHRIKNNMGIVKSLLSLQAGRAAEPSVARALENAGNRIDSMMVLYDRLYRSSGYTDLSLGDYLAALADDVIANFPDCGRIRIERRIEDIMIDAKTLSLVGIMANEILTNCLKYAFQGREEGTITMEASREGRTVALAIADDGIGIPATVSQGTGSGFGLTLLGILAEQLGGKVDIEGGRGTKISLRFEL